MITVAVLGARGRMGAEVCRAVTAADDLSLGAQLGSSDDVTAMSGANVVVDFTHPDVVMDQLSWAIGAGIHAVVGTTGFTQQRLDTVRGWLEQAPAVGVVIASNFSVGAVLMMRFAEQAARFYRNAEIVELHRAAKVDAPSGSSATTAQRISAAWRTAADETGPSPLSSQGASAVSADHQAAGARGAEVDGVRIHSVRLPGFVAHQEVLFGAEGETLTIRHDSMDRASFMPGVLAAVRAVPSMPGLSLGIDALLDDSLGETKCKE